MVERLAARVVADILLLPFVQLVVGFRHQGAALPSSYAAIATIFLGVVERASALFFLPSL